MKKTAVIICLNDKTEFNSLNLNELIKTSANYFFDEVIVVNNSSNEDINTSLCKLNKFYNFKYIQLYEENKGANYAQAIGIENTNADIISFVDSDLSNIKEKHFAQLFLPLVNNEADLVLGLAVNTLINYKIESNKSLYITRTVFRKDILCILGDLMFSKFSIDTLLNSHYQYHGKRIKYIALEDINN